MRPRVLLIWNPVATGVDAESVGTASVVAAEHVDVAARHTLGQSDARRLAEEAPDAGFDAVFVLGGDGTANEVLNGLGNRLPIGVLPAGGPSVLPRALGLASEIGACAGELCEALLAARVREATVGTLNGRRFAFAAGIGIDAAIVQRVDERGGGGLDAKRPGDLWFVKDALDVVRKGGYAQARMTVDGHPDGSFRAMTVFAANTDPWSDAGPLPLRIAPDARFERGLELAALVKPIEARSGIARLRALLTRDHGDDDAVRRLTNVEHVRIVCDVPTPTQIDGELVGKLTEIELGVVERGARFLVPPREEHG